MCNITSVRNALLLLAGAVALAASSAMFGLGFVNAGFLAWLMYVGLGAAVGWSAVAAALLVGATNALNTFCSCASGSAACVSACTAMRALLGVIAASLVVLIGACAALMINPANAVAAGVIFVTSLVLTASLLALLGIGLALGGCQAPVRMPGGPPVGAGPGPAPI